MRSHIAALSLALLTGSLVAAAGPGPVSAERKAEILRHLLPLPHEIVLEAEMALAPADVGLVLRPDAGEIERQAGAELNGLFREKAGCEAAGKGFRIVIGVLDGQGKLGGQPVEGADRLKALPHPDQAYLIRPRGDAEMAVAALHERGVYYGVQTLRQLIESGVSGERVRIPLATVTDWPDLDERGVWNYETTKFDARYASMKLNFVCTHVACDPSPIRRDQPVGLKKLAFYLEARRRLAFDPVFSITHLNFLDRQDGLYDAYPELAGRGERAWQKANPHPKHRVPCASNPLMAKVLTEMLTSAAEQGVPEMSVWLSEFDSQCECPACLQAGQAVAETNAILAAWRQVRQKSPNLGLRLFYAITPAKDQLAEYFAKMPIEVKLERCGVESKPTKPRPTYFNPGFDDFAARGGWVASYDVPVRIEGFAPGRTRDFIRQLHARKWQGAYGFGPRGERDDFGFSAIAEWGWNTAGRSVAEFAAAWAARRGYPKPETFGEWAAAIDPVQWDIWQSYGNDRLLRSVAGRIKARPAGKIDPARYPDGLYLAGSTLEFFPKPESFDEKIAAVERLTPLAEATGSSAAVVDTRRTLAHLRVLKGIYLVLRQVYVEDLAQPAARDALRQAFAGLQAASRDEIDAMNEFYALGKIDPPATATRAADDRRQTREAILKDVAAEIVKLTESNGPTTRKD